MHQQTILNFISILWLFGTISGKFMILFSFYQYLILFQNFTVLFGNIMKINSSVLVRGCICWNNRIWYAYIMHAGKLALTRYIHTYIQTATRIICVKSFSKTSWPLFLKKWKMYFLSLSLSTPLSFYLLNWKTRRMPDEEGNGWHGEGKWWGKIKIYKKNIK